MNGVDPDTLLDWLQTGTGDERVLQLTALEQLCMLLLMSDNIDRIFESCPPRLFLPALGKIFLDETVPEKILEVTARAITYYLDVSNECTRRITQVEGAIKAICNRMIVADMTDRTSKDLAEQIVKLLEHICQRDAYVVYEAGGLQCMLHLICQNSRYIHKDTMHSAMTVITRLCSKVDPKDSNLSKFSSDLGVLLSHDDPKISECALRCFVALTDRCIRKSLDPIELTGSSNLIEHLLNLLLSLSETKSEENVVVTEKDVNKIVNLDNKIKSPAFISVVISLLSNLCRGSAAVTDQVTRSPRFFNALKSVLQCKDERCVTDSLRLADLLIVLLCEGRLYLSKFSKTELTLNETPTSTYSNNFGRVHRSLIEAIRQKDTDALIDAIESGSIDSNFMDDVGQTLLNWCSAFGTKDMVTYLCEKGADPNKGQRSSSLHYAACFGRPEIVKILLQYEANPDLNDEEGHTALEKARERNDEGHQQVIQILENPSNFMVFTCNENNAMQQSELDKLENNLNTEFSFDVKNNKEQQLLNTDFSFAKTVLQQLVSIFCDIYQKLFSSAIQRLTLFLIQKCVFYLSKEGLLELIQHNTDFDKNLIEANDFVENLMNVLVTVFSFENDNEAKEQALLILKYLLKNDTEFWLEQIIRLGVFEKVEALTNNFISTKEYYKLLYENLKTENTNKSVSNLINETLNDVFKVKKSQLVSSSCNKSKENFDLRSDNFLLPFTTSKDEISNLQTKMDVTNIKKEIDNSRQEIKVNKRKLSINNVDTNSANVDCISDNAIEITNKKFEENKQFFLNGYIYRWNDWRLLKGKDSVFLWCDVIAIEFSESSNGWFKYLMDGKLYTMFSNGIVELNSDTTKNRSDFISKIQKEKSEIVSKTLLKPLFSNANKFDVLEFGNWQILNVEWNTLNFNNFEKKEKIKINCKTIIKADFPGFLFETDKNKTQCFIAESSLGLDFVTGWTARNGKRCLNFCSETQKQKLHELAQFLWTNYLKDAKTKPREALISLQKDAKEINELVSEICQAEKNYNTLNNVGIKVLKLNEVLVRVRNAVSNERLLSTFELLISNIVPALSNVLEAVLKNNSQTIANCFLTVFSKKQDLNLLVRKIVLVLEYSENFVQQLYDTPGGSPFGLQLLTRRFAFQMEQFNSNVDNILFDRTGRTIKIEPLVTVRTLRQHLYNMLTKQWYDYPRKSLHFVKQLKKLKENNKTLEFVYKSDFDTNGLIWYLGTNGQNSNEWTNPSIIKIVNIYCSEDEKQPYTQCANFLSRNIKPLNCHTSNTIDANFTIDLGVWLIPTAYTLRHALGHKKHALRNWILQASKENFVWDVLMTHNDDCSLNDCGATATWKINCENNVQNSYRYFRIAYNEKNQKNTSFVISISGFEIYGIVVDVVENELKTIQAFSNYKDSKLSSKSQLSPFFSSLPAKNKKQKISNNILSNFDLKNSSSPINQNLTMTNVNYSRLPTTTFMRHTRKQKIYKNASDVLNDKNRLENIERRIDSLKQNDLNLETPLGTNMRILQNQRNCNFNLTTFFDTPVNKININCLSDLKLLTTYLSIDSFYKVGARVVPGPDFQWKKSKDQKIGTVISIGKNKGWAEVKWDDGSVNAYRFGQEGKFDIEPQNEHAKKLLLKSILSLCQQKTIQNSNQSLQNVVTDFNKTLKPIKNALHLNKNKFTNTNDSEITNDNQKTLNLDLKNDLLIATTGSVVTQKSMSVTNLFDNQYKIAHSVASTNQAASAESLQHQTPSLENLLACYCMYNDQIPEINHEQYLSTFDESPIDNTISKKTLTSDSSISTNSHANNSQPMLSTSKASANLNIAFSFDELTNKSSNQTKSLNNFSGLEEESLNDDTFIINSFLPKKCNENFKLCGNNKERFNKSEENKNILNKKCIVEKNELTKTKKKILNNDEKGVTKNCKKNFVSKEGNLLSSVGELNSELTETSKYCNKLIKIACKDKDNIKKNEIYVNSLDILEQEDKKNSNKSVKQLLTAKKTRLNKYVENMFLQNFLTTEDLKLVDKSNEYFASNSNVIEDFQHNKDASTSSAISTLKDTIYSEALNNANKNRNYKKLPDVDFDLQYKLGNYANVLKDIIQQVIDSNEVIGVSFEHDDLENEIFNNEILTTQKIENNCNINFSNQYESFGILQDQCSAETFNDVLNTIKYTSSKKRLETNLSFVNKKSSNNLINSNLRKNDKIDWRKMFLNTFSANKTITSATLPQYASTSNEIGQERLNNVNTRLAEKRSLRVWEDDYVLKRQFSSLIPAFDPRPGRTNVNQTQEVEITNNANTKFVRKGSVVKEVYSLSSKCLEDEHQKVRLYLKGPNLPNIKNEMIELKDEDASIFYYIQKLSNIIDWDNNNTNNSQTENNRRIWEVTYTIVYETAIVSENGEIVKMPSDELKKLLDLSSKKFVDKNEFGGIVNDCLKLIKSLNIVSNKFKILLPHDSFYSLKLTQKLSQCLTDPLIVAAASLPYWCNRLVFDYLCLFPLETRIMHLKTTAFGASRAITYLQNRRDQILDQNRLSGGVVNGLINLAGSRRDDHYPEYRIGRIKHERIKVYRNDKFLLENAIRIMNFHAMRKSILEIEYYDEEGTGLGPTLEFYALVAAEFQRKSLMMWFCDDSDVGEQELESDSIDLGEGEKPPGYYIRRTGGLFPAYHEPNTPDCVEVCKLFKVFGIFLAKILLDGRLVDIPLSPLFFKLILSSKVAYDDNLCLDGILDIDDFKQIYSLKARFLQSLNKLIDQKNKILNSKNLNDLEKSASISALRLRLEYENQNVIECSIEDLSLNFVINYPSSIFNGGEIELIENGSNVNVTIHNVEDYVNKCLEFYLNKGIKNQIIAFREGFDLVFPLKSLTLFTPQELQILLFGEQSPKWTRDEILRYTEPKLGYSRNSPGFLRFVDVLVEMNAQERKAFLQFTTGCSSLPPGGLINLHPRLTIVRKVEAGDGSYPSVNTCVHYLKLPEYSNTVILKERLLAATFEKGFHLN